MENCTEEEERKDAMVCAAGARILRYFDGGVRAKPRRAQESVQSQ